ncbi:hypothetical protein [Helicobacter ibis]|uniref:YkgJ family cysteine cluster protein n=1 Tax=Helicobacter ibis TaxID=2962633 RepID=A0ABT4VFQ4_9HELI|nr:hypothetical protein [Helicobacter ibis]MDA3969557.1 hypothetical protein [Helicobacter ibis]
MIWEYIYNTEFVAFKDCHLTCNGYCCTMNKEFSILSKITLPLLEDEYSYYEQNGGISNIDEIKKEEFTLLNGKNLTLYYLICDCKGLCNPHSMRPLICRIYPFIPKISYKGECEGFLYASFFDVIYNDTNHPCTLVREHKEEIFENLKEKLEPLLHEPKLIFAFKALEIVYSYLLAKLDLTQDINTLNKKLEFLLLSRKAWNNEDFKQEITQSYEKIVKNFGEFL